SVEQTSFGGVVEVLPPPSLPHLFPAATPQQEGGFKVFSLPPPLLERTAVLLRRKNSWQTAAAKAFLHMALEECADVGENESR
ncbi:transcriptional regulator CynR, partial [Escherichia coli]